jgi:UDP-N-acetylglucosamine 3-dehydrogenase
MASKRQPVGIVVIGLGGFGNFIATRIRETTSLTLLGGYDPDVQAARNWEKQWGVPAFSSLEEALTTKGVESVFLASPNHLHLEHTAAAVNHSLHVFTTKPVSNSVTDAQKIIELCEQNHLVFYLDHPPAEWNGWPRIMQERINNGEIGQLVMGEANGSSPSGLILQPHQWRWSAGLCPGGSLIQLGIYQADVLCYLLGDPQRVSSFFNHLYVEAAIPDVTVTIIEFANGLLGYLGSSYAAGSDPFWVKIHGTKGSLEQSNREGLFIRKGRYSALEMLVAPEDDAALYERYRLMLADFARRVRQGDIVSDWTTALQGLAIINAAVLSQERGAPVAIDEVWRVAGT